MKLIKTMRIALLLCVCHNLTAQINITGQTSQNNEGQEITTDKEAENLINLDSNLETITNSSPEDESNFIYALRGNNEKDFWRYDIDTDEWTDLEETPENVKNGGSLAYTGDDHIFAVRGDNKDDFWRYEISTDSWTAMEDTPENVKDGGAIVYNGDDYIYAFMGNDRKSFFRYEISSDSWDQMEDTPEKVKEGGSLVMSSTGIIYALRGNNKEDFWSYTPSNDSWTILEDAPARVKKGGDLTITSNDEIYAFRGNHEEDFWRYDIDTDEWTELEDAPDDIDSGGSLAAVGDDIFATRGHDSDEFWRYDIEEDEWSEMEDAPEDVKYGGALASTNVSAGGSGEMASIGDFVWLDTDQDGMQGSSESGINDVKVYLCRPGGIVVDSVWTATNDDPSSPDFGKDGYFMFESLESGDYYLEFFAPEGSTFTPSNQGSDDYMDSDVDGSNGANTTQTVTLTAGMVDQGVDAGVQNSIVPIKLISFTADLKSNNTVLLEWATANEINNQQFEIERRSEYGPFETIHSEAGAGTSFEVNHYAHTDTKLNQSGNYYYRLKQIDFDGRSSYSDVVIVTVETIKELDLSTYPNPTIDYINLELNTSDETTSNVYLIDMTGRLVKQATSIALSRGYRMDVSELIPGTYNLIIETGNSRISEKIVKTNNW